MTNKKHVIFLFKICNKNKYLYYIIMKDSIFLVYVRKYMLENVDCVTK